VEVTLFVLGLAVGGLAGWFAGRTKERSDAFERSWQEQKAREAATAAETEKLPPSE
jgi:hypothetical protein